MEWNPIKLYPSDDTLLTTLSFFFLFHRFSDSPISLSDLHFNHSSIFSILLLSSFRHLNILRGDNKNAGYLIIIIFFNPHLRITTAS